MTTTPKLSLPVLVEGQTNSENTVNDSFKLLDALTSGRVEDRDLTVPPASPSEGAMYIVGASATGDWSGQDDNIAIYNSGWSFIAPVGGLQIFVHDEKALFCYSSVEAEWFPVQTLYSTTEHWTGRYGEGGSKIYAKCFAGLSCPNTTTTNHAHSITGLDISKRIDFEASFNDGSTSQEINFSQSATIMIYLKIDGTNLKITSTANFSSNTADVRLEYCKT